MSTAHIWSSLTVTIRLLTQTPSLHGCPAAVITAPKGSIRPLSGCHQALLLFGALLITDNQPCQLGRPAAGCKRRPLCLLLSCSERMGLTETLWKPRLRAARIIPDQLLGFPLTLKNGAVFNEKII